MPRISVIMPVYNCENYIQEAVESILKQSFGDFEFLIFDDASTDRTVNIIKTFTDSRIHLTVKPVNSGYTDSLNMGLKMASGELIARMDGDDISQPNRFALQLKEFESNKNLVLCGSNMEVIGTGEIIKYPQTHDDIKVEFLKICCIAHPSVMMKSSFLRDNNLFYDRAKEPAEDYDLWVRMIKNGLFANVSQPLLKYRVHANQVSTTKQAIREASAMRTKVFHLSSIVNKATAKKFYSIDSVIDAKNVSKELAFFNWLQRETRYFNKRNKSVFFFAEPSFNKYLEENKKANARKLFLQSKIYDPNKFFYFIRYAIRNPGTFSFFELIKNSIKCLTFYSIN